MTLQFGLGHFQLVVDYGAGSVVVMLGQNDASNPI